MIASKKIFFLFILCFLSNFSIAQIDILNHKISIEFNDLELEKCLYKIGKQKNISFSYNPDHFNIENRINKTYSDIELKIILKDILNHNIQIKSIGSTIILRNPNHNKSTKKTKYDITGIIYDSETGKKISQASVFQVDGVRSALSNNNGFYKIKVVSEKQYVEISYNHNKYQDTVIIIKPSEINTIKIELKPKNISPTSPRKVSEIPESENRKIDSSTIVKILIPKKNRWLIENIPFLNKLQPVQLSFIPTIGTNLNMNAAMENKASVNVLAGYSRAINGFEVGGILNMVREEMNGIQIAGIGNLVGGNVNGFQTAGIFNTVKGSANGIQVAGISNFVLDSISGFQLAGIMNITNNKVEGLQTSGFLNFAGKSVDGYQVAGFTNFTFDTVTKLQLSGFGNYAKRIEGVQASGFINIAKNVKGVQFGFINIADTVSGVSLGIFNLIRKGYHSIEINLTDYQTTSLRIKTGTRKFYNILEAGINIDKKYWHYNYGIGRSFTLRNKKSYADLEINTGVINPNTGFNNNFNLLNKVEILFSYRLIGPVYLFFGPNASSFIYENNYDKPFQITFKELSKINTNSLKIENYIGYRFGLRI